MAVEAHEDVGVEFTTMSKGYNMAGWRVGFCAGNADMVRGLATIKGYYDYGMFQAIQIAAIVALRDTEATVEKQSRIYQGRRDVLLDGLRRLGWEAATPRAGMFVWAKIPSYYKNGYELSDQVLHKSNVFITPGGIFGKAGDKYVRVSLCSTEEKIDESINRVKAILDFKS